jgi:hypothetical protein
LTGVSTGLERAVGRFLPIDGEGIGVFKCVVQVERNGGE